MRWCDMGDNVAKKMKTTMPQNNLVYEYRELSIAIKATSKKVQILGYTKCILQAQLIHSFQKEIH